jgi:hypothetical protein
MDGTTRPAFLNLTDRGLQRNRITYIREMDQAELKRVGRAEPTIDKIDIVEFQSVEEEREWMGKFARVFVRDSA